MGLPMAAPDKAVRAVYPAPVGGGQFATFTVALQAIRTLQHQRHRLSRGRLVGSSTATTSQPRW